MRYPMHALYYIWLFLLFLGCQPPQKKALKAEYIQRRHDEYFYLPPPPLSFELPRYPWQENIVGGFPKITKEFFRCNCGKHSLPLREGKEFVYPCLIDLLNFIQGSTGQRVVITCGHRCPTRNKNADNSPQNRASRHLLAAEVDFYLEGESLTPERLLSLLQQYYTRHHEGKKEYLCFSRYQKEGLNVSTPPWCNKEIFIKYYLPHEGRDLDNSHSHPYFGLQVRQVTFDQRQVENYLRDW